LHNGGLFFYTPYTCLAPPLPTSPLGEKL